MISHRFIPIVCLLLAAALVPTIIHSYSGATHDDRRTTAAIPAVLVGHDSVPSERDETWGKRRFDSDDWTEPVAEMYGRSESEVANLLESNGARVLEIDSPEVEGVERSRTYFVEKHSTSSAG
jgi:hypothetical protein